MKKPKAIEFEVEKTVRYWLDGAKYDIGVAESLFKAKKYPYALFMGHLALEKLLKAIYVKKTESHAPYSHSLNRLAEESGLEISEQTITKLKNFNDFNIESRYPSEQMAFYKKCTFAYTTENLREIKRIYKWLKGQLQ